jgi:hypothetical protein
MDKSFLVCVADDRHGKFAEMICEEMETSAKARGTGISKRSPEYIREKMREGKAVIAFSLVGDWAGFCYIESWDQGKYVSNSGLIVASRFRHSGIAKEIKKEIFELSRKRFPNAKVFGLTTGMAVMKINSDMGYEPVTYSEITGDAAFWKGCQSCVNFQILQSKERKNCLCTAMLYSPEVKEKEDSKAEANKTGNGVSGGHQLSTRSDHDHSRYNYMYSIVEEILPLRC